MSRVNLQSVHEYRAVEVKVKGKLVQKNVLFLKKIKIIFGF